MKIIKINQNYELGSVLAKIKVETEDNIILEIDSSLDKNEIKNDVDLIKDYAKKTGKILNINENSQFKKVGFVTNTDINSMEEPPLVEKTKVKRDIRFNLDFMRKVKIPKFNFPILPIIAVILILGSIIFYIMSIYFLPKAIIQIKLDSKAFSVTEELLASINKSELENSILAQKTTLTVKDTATAIPTGEKEIGDMAKGKLKIFNKTSENIDIKKGQIVYLDTKKDKSYLTLTDITVEKKTTQDITNSDGTTSKADVYGSKEVEIESQTLGEIYNIDKKNVKNEDISLKGQSADDVTFELTKSLEGGTSKKTTVALQSDLDSLLDATQKKLEQRATDEIRSKSTDTAYFSEGAYTTTVTKKVFNVKANDEASQIDLEMEVEITALTFNKTELIERLKPNLKKQVPENYNLSENTNSIEVFSSTKTKIFDEKTKIFTGATLVNRIQTTLVPKIDENKIKSDLSGVSYEKAVEYLQDIEGATGTIKQAGANVFAFSKTLPKNKDNIKIEVTINENTP
ncbi:hypothetical protein KA001_00635 [Patescibacteria group bacterium]|nr:hypothetical protein [Patescibacteria group bacterium]